MGRILAIDYGKKRTGLAVTDVLKLSINGLETQESKHLLNFLTTFVNTEEVEIILIGWPTHHDGTETALTQEIKNLEMAIKKLNPVIELVRVDESYTSVEAKAMILAQGVKKKKRRQKELTDKVSAMIILQRYLKNNT